MDIQWHLIETLYREFNWRFHDRDLIRLTRCHMASEKFDAETFTQHTSFYLTSYVTDINYITHQHFFVYLYQPIHWHLARILTFLSEQRAPFSTIFASTAFHNVILSQHCNVQVSIFVTCLNFAGTGSRLWQMYVAFVMTWYLAFKTSGHTALYQEKMTYLSYFLDYVDKDIYVQKYWCVGASY